MYNGGIIGKKNLPTYFNGNGIRNAREVRNFLEDGLWHFDAAVTANASSYTEGDSISISINTTGLPDGTNLYWTVNTLSGTTLSTADFTDKVLDGTANIVNNTYNTTKKFVSDRIPDGNRQWTVVFRTESIAGPIIASTPVLALNDYVRGGDAVFDRNGYRYHKFTYSNWIYTAKNVPCEVLVVAGGGGGGGNGGGGGGAGGLRWDNVTIPANLSGRWVQVGGGGSWSGGGNNGSDGGSSYIDGVIGCTGGGGGGSRDGGSAGRYGGSGGGGGGGGGGRAGAGNPVPGEGNWGGSGYDNGTSSAGGGGGGAGGAGGNAGSRAAGNGGPGRGIDFARDGTTEYYAGGGGAGRTYYGTAGSDGIGQGTSRGSGGHGESGGTAYRAGSNGDSGIVFIRYVIPT